MCFVCFLLLLGEGCVLLGSFILFWVCFFVLLVFILQIEKCRGFLIRPRVPNLLNVGLAIADH